MVHFIENKLNSSLKDLVTAITALNSITNETIVQTTLRTNLKHNDLLPFADFNHPINESYGRRLLFCDDNFEMWLMTWCPGDFTAIHDHGSTDWGCVLFFGEATHREYHFVNGCLQLKRSDFFKSGQVVPVCGQLIHMMGNTGPEPFFTLHIYGYGANSADCARHETLYYPEHLRTIASDGPAFHCLNPKKITESTPFDATEEETLADYLHLVKAFFERNNCLHLLENAMPTIETQNHLPT